MGGLFSKKKDRDSREQRPDRVDDTDKALLDLKMQCDQLVMHKRKLEKIVVKDEEAARKMMRDGRDKKVIMLALKKKKHHQGLVDDTTGHVMKIQELVSNVEMQKINQNVVEALSGGVGALKVLQKECNADMVQDLLDENADQQAMVEEIGALLGQQGINDEDVDEEYAQIEEMLGLEAAAEQIEKMPVKPANLPEVEPAAADPVTAEPEQKRQMEAS